MAIVTQTDTRSGITYNAEESDSPPNEKIKSMRANPEGISYLYAAEDVKTAIMEMRPINGQLFSVATIEITDCIRLFDLLQSKRLKKRTTSQLA